MKSLLLIVTAIVLTASAALATKPSTETAQVMRALINSPVVVAQLDKNETTSLRDVKIETVKPGVNQYTLTFVRTCFCLPSTATVSILEDLTPTFSDGPAVYISTVEFKSE